MAQKIVRVEVLDEQLECIAVELENGSIAIIELTARHSDPLFAEIKNLSRPRTDGERVYWPNGASLTVDEIMEMIEKEKPAAGKAESHVE